MNQATNSLADYMKDKEFSEAEVLTILVPILKGVECLHFDNVLHRDIKPDNILMFDDSIKLTDFGVAT